MKKPTKRDIAILVLIATLAVDTVLAIFLIPHFLKKIQSITSSEEYEVSEDTPLIYNNMCTYLNNKVDYLEGFEDIKDIYAVQFINRQLLIAALCETTYVYLEITTNYNNINECISSFKEGSITDTDFSITKETSSMNVVNIKEKEVRGEVTTDGVKEYVSFTLEYKNGMMGSLVHQEYLESGNYENITMVKHDDNPLLFDLYFY